jgi:hypothetical protein
MSTCPLGVGHGIFRFDGPAQQLRDELKLAVRAKLIANETERSLVELADVVRRAQDYGRLDNA